MLHFISVQLGYNFEPPHTRILHSPLATCLQHRAKLVRPDYSGVFQYGGPVYVLLEAIHAMWRCDPRETLRVHYIVLVKELLYVCDTYLTHWEGDFKLHSNDVSSEDALARHYHRTSLATNLGQPCEVEGRRHRLIEYAIDADGINLLLISEPDSIPAFRRVEWLQWPSQQDLRFEFRAPMALPYPSQYLADCTLIAAEHNIANAENAGVVLSEQRPDDTEARLPDNKDEDEDEDEEGSVFVKEED